MHVHRSRFYAAALLALGCAWPAAAQERAEGPVFRSTVDLVSMTAVVRDRQGRPVPALTREDFEIVDGGRRPPILDLQADRSAPASVALLVDGSGSMRVGGLLDASRRIAATLLAALEPDRDAAALFSFDTRLLTLCDFTSDLDKVGSALGGLDSWGSTSLYDAIAGVAGFSAERTRTRRAVIVLTDGADNTSTYSPLQVAAIASTIDVPVYVLALGMPRDANGDGEPDQVPSDPLAALARETGGDYYIANTPALAAAATRSVLDELRHQYVLAFESAQASGMRQVEIRMRRSRLRVTSRRWYLAGTGE